MSDSDKYILHGGMIMPTSAKVKVGIVGCGVVATAYYLPYLMDMDTVEITAVCDLYETRTKASVRLFGAKEQYLDYYEMIKNE
jgi:predicted dehydrogenase